MNLITEPTISPATKTALLIERRRLAGLENLKQTTIGLFKALWYPAEGLTPQDIADEFGVNTVNAFTQHAATVAYLVSQGVTFDSKDIVPPADKYTYVINNDGTVTITDVVV